MAEFATVIEHLSRDGPVTVVDDVPQATARKARVNVKLLKTSFIRFQPLARFRSSCTVASCFRLTADSPKRTREPRELAERDRLGRFRGTSRSGSSGRATVLVARLIPLVTSETLRLPDDLSLSTVKAVADAPKNIIYRIRLTERTGRFEKR